MNKLPVLEPTCAQPKLFTAALVGNPNAGKTSLFNKLTGLRSKTANYPGITVDIRKGTLKLDEGDVELIDLPGLYSLDALSLEEELSKSVLTGKVPGETTPDVVVLVLDATNLQRNLFLASEVLDLKLPTIIALSLIDAATAEGIKIDVDAISKKLNCLVIPVSARTGAGLDHLRKTLDEILSKQQSTNESEHTSCTVGCTGCTYTARYNWAEKIVDTDVAIPGDHGQITASIDRVLTNPVLGIVGFIAVMLGVFYLIFSLASIPMELIDNGFGLIATAVERLIPETIVHSAGWSAITFVVGMSLFGIGYWLKKTAWNWKTGAAAIVVSAVVSQLPVEDFRSLLVDGIIGGLSGVVIFLPQICILFFFITLLEDSGYMARAAFVMERLMRKVGLPGKAFVPMLSAHACAIPGIMAARAIENWRDRLVTILVLPLLTCSARLPVYAMVAALLFSKSPGIAAMVFVGAYLLGIIAALLTALVLKKTILRGDTEPLVLELPAYRMPNIRNALLTVMDRASIFLRKAGSVILVITVVLWAMLTYPKMSEDNLPYIKAQEVALIRVMADRENNSDERDLLLAHADQIISQQGLANSFAGRMGRLVEPVFKPLGFDWKINVGVISSFAAREVILPTLAIVYGISEDDADAENETFTQTLQNQKRPDGKPVYTTATCFSLLVFYVLAMQCLPTQVITRRETGSWKWAIIQLVYMTALAYISALIVFQILVACGMN